MNGLHESSLNIKRAQNALERAYNTCDLNERLRCIHNARRFLDDSWKQLTKWRKGDPGTEAGPTDSSAGVPAGGSTDEPDEAPATSVAPD